MWCGPLRSLSVISPFGQVPIVAKMKDLLRVKYQGLYAYCGRVQKARVIQHPFFRETCFVTFPFSRYLRKVVIPLDNCYRCWKLGWRLFLFIFYLIGYNYDPVDMRFLNWIKD